MNTTDFIVERALYRKSHVLLRRACRCGEVRGVNAEGRVCPALQH